MITRIQYQALILQSLGVDVLTVWIPGHCDHPMGDRADLLAKAFSTDTSTPSLPTPLVPVPYKVAVAFTKARLSFWVDNHWWSSSNLDLTSPSPLFKFQQLANSPPTIISLIRDRRPRTIRCIFRLLLGLCSDNKFLFHSRLLSTPSCSYCPLTSDSASHRLFDCHHYNSFRLESKSSLYQLDPHLPFSFTTFLQLEDVATRDRQRVADIFCDFLEKSRLTHVFVFSNRQASLRNSPPSIINPHLPYLQRSPSLLSSGTSTPDLSSLDLL